MNAPAFENLDLACAKVGKSIADRPSKDLNLENLITSALAVLEEQGIYALFLYLDKGVSGNEKKKFAKSVKHRLYKFLQQTPRQTPVLSMGDNDIFTALQRLGENLDNLLLARDLLRQTLVYARYHAKMHDAEEAKQ